MRFIGADIPKICVENPVGFMNTAFRKPDMTIHPYMFADSTEDAEKWDNPRDDLEKYFQRFAETTTHKPHGRFGTVYVLTGYDSTMEENLYRIYTLSDLGYDPYVMIYNKPNAPRELIRLQRWCNNRWVYKACPKFEDYKKG